VAESSVLFDVTDNVAIITLNRPDRSNAFDLPTARLFGDLVSRVAAEEIGVVLIRGSGKAFCAGGDLQSMVATGLSAATLTELASTVDAALVALARLDKPVVAAVHGAVAGAGIGLLLSCDIAVAAASSRFVMAYHKVGLTPDCGVSYLLPRAIGQQRALELALTGRVLDAAEAASWGLVTEVVEDDAVHQHAADLVDRLAQQSTFALGQAKRLIRSSWAVSRETSGRDEAETIGTAAEAADARQLIAAFTKPRA
jgi:2-(1,2-epoxy-1,2-dihydrophenyl)acetyl-CoA isomerase